MRNFILLNYNINVDKIYYKEKEKFFYIYEKKIRIIECDYDDNYIRELFRLTNELYNEGIKIDTFILSNKGNCYTLKNSSKIILLKENDYNCVTLKYILSFRGKHNYLKNIDILDVWKNEVDLIEKELIEYNKEYPLIKESIDYFIGCAENGISLINNYKEKIINNALGHKIDYNFFNDINNPFLLIKTNSMYDVANYFKYQFLIKKIDYNEVDYIIDNNDETENAFLFANMLYPTIYFSIVKNVLLTNIKEEKVKIITNTRNQYSKLLIYFQNRIKNVKMIKLFYWFNE